MAVFTIKASRPKRSHVELAAEGPKNPHLVVSSPKRHKLVHNIGLQVCGTAGPVIATSASSLDSGSNAVGGEKFARKYYCITKAFSGAFLF